MKDFHGEGSAGYGVGRGVAVKSRKLSRIVSLLRSFPNSDNDLVCIHCSRCDDEL